MRFATPTACLPRRGRPTEGARAVEVTADASRAVEVTSRTVDVDGPVHYADFGGDPDGATIVCVHGLGGSHRNWLAVAPGLAELGHVLALDLVGHGLTPAGGRVPDVEGHRRLLAGFLGVVVGRPVILVGNSMGALVTALVASEVPELVAGLVLVDPALPVRSIAPFRPSVVANFAACAIPGVGEAYLGVRRRQTTAEQSVRRVLRSCCVDPARVPTSVVAAHVALTEEVDWFAADAAYLTSARSLARRFVASGATCAALDRIEQPTVVLHGARDRIVPLRVARALVAAHPGWQLEVAVDAGHAPMLEVPAWTVEAITRWVRGASRTPTAGWPTDWDDGRLPER
ncbi:MAG: alpha/beta fold hydrolase [Acidimicrobiales bacterium]